MTIIEVMEIVRAETGEDVTPETKLDSLGLDSLEFLDLLLAVGDIPDSLVPHLNTVNDLYLAATGQ